MAESAPYPSAAPIARSCTPGPPPVLQSAPLPHTHIQLGHALQVPFGGMHSTGAVGSPDSNAEHPGWGQPRTSVAAQLDAKTPKCPTNGLLANPEFECNGGHRVAALVEPGGMVHLFSGQPADPSRALDAVAIQMRVDSRAVHTWAAPFVEGGSWEPGGTTSTSTPRWGTARSSHLGIHQLARPSTSITEGTRTIRTSVASMRTAVASPRPSTSPVSEQHIAQGSP